MAESERLRRRPLAEPPSSVRTTTGNGDSPLTGGGYGSGQDQACHANDHRGEREAGAMRHSLLLVLLSHKVRPGP